VAQSAQEAIGEHPSVAMAVAVELTAVRQVFGDVVALDRVDLTVPRHSRLAVVGPSGGGKSTLLSLVAGLQEPLSGTVRVEDATGPRERLARCALMPQQDLLLPWRSALDNAILALENQGVSRRDARERARPLLVRLGLESFEHRRPSELSGGMRQRVAFLRTLLAGKDVLLLDEPFGALDAITRVAMQRFLLELWERERITIVFVTHDVEEAALLGDRVCVMTGSPGRTAALIDVDLPRPRRLEDTETLEFVRLKRRIREALEGVAA
jgi:NitT/TauT family transport system ATP-binding protein